MYRKLIGSLGIVAMVFTATSSPNQAGNVPGPISVSEIVPADDSHTYDVALLGGEPTVIAVSGDGDSDLDLYVYDQAGNLVAYDNDMTDECVVVVAPRFSGSFRIVIVNRGPDANLYEMVTT